MFKWVLDEFLAHFVQPVVDGWPVVAVSFGFWLGLQLTLDYIFPSICPSWYQAIRNSSQKESWANIRTRIMGSLYGIYAASVAVYALLNCSSTLQSNWYEHDDFVHTYVVSVAVGWFIWDVIECAQHTEWGPLFLVHGIVALGIFSSCMKPFLLHTAAIVLMYEASTPIMHLRKALLTLGYAKSHPNMFIGVSAVFFLVFFVTRIAVGLWASVIWWQDAVALVSGGEPHSFLVLGFDMMANVVMNGMNLLWFWQMLKVLLRGINVKSIEEADKKQM